MARRAYRRPERFPAPHVATWSTRLAPAPDRRAVMRQLPQRLRARDAARPVPSARRGRVSARRRATSPAACPPRASRDPNRGLLDLCPSLDPSPSLSTARQSIPLDLLVEIAPRHLQCARGLRHVPVVLLQLAKEERALRRLLEFFERAGAQPGGISCRATHATLPSSPFPLPDKPLDIVLSHRGAGRQNEQPFDRVLQLPDVAGPIMRREPLDRGRIDLLDRKSAALRQLVREMRDQLRDVATSLAQRG